MRGQTLSTHIKCHFLNPCDQLKCHKTKLYTFFAYRLAVLNRTCIFHNINIYFFINNVSKCHWSCLMTPKRSWRKVELDCQVLDRMMRIENRGMETSLKDNSCEVLICQVMNESSANPEHSEMDSFSSTAQH